ncbi:unnamed protein product [Spirodela intermedia]|uniref:Uncharacterized protein n=1 Tax=Spirodela intermedia TaxID=51605 RepID=A0A7I8JPS9_SPIIN|nr:unnamed protein product [Spirodela intermedia]CAA6672188.1 unnamed protein product [Spirodela intermedia]
MDLVSSCRATERRKPSPSTPVKAFSPGAAAAAATNQKLAELPRRIRNRGVAFSMKEVRKIAASLRQPHGKDTALGPIFDNVQKRLPLKPLPKLTETEVFLWTSAQLKYILPEAMCIKKILRHDEPTSCMKPDLQLSCRSMPLQTAMSRRRVFGHR